MDHAMLEIQACINYLQTVKRFCKLLFLMYTYWLYLLLMLWSVLKINMAYSYMLYYTSISKISFLKLIFEFKIWHSYGKVVCIEGFALKVLHHFMTCIDEQKTFWIHRNFHDKSVSHFIDWILHFQGILNEIEMDCFVPKDNIIASP